MMIRPNPHDTRFASTRLAERACPSEDVHQMLDEIVVARINGLRDLAEFGRARKSVLQHDVNEMAERIADRVATRLEKEQTSQIKEALGSDTLIDYTTWRKANNISHELGMKLRREGKLKVLQVGGKLMIRLGHARDFVRKLPLAK
jgi:hypothetical protein